MAPKYVFFLPHAIGRIIHAATPRAWDSAAQRYLGDISPKCVLTPNFSDSVL
jgi:hypothetical protein